MIRACPTCGQQNRIPPARLADDAKCGKCKAALGPLGEPIDVVDARTFDEIVNQARVPVLIDFWAEWCAPCRMAAPEVKKAAQHAAGKAVVLKVDTERLPDLARRFQVTSIPNFVVMNGGKVAMQKPGLVDHRQMVRWLEATSSSGRAA
jgi:thioredoxin 2